MVRMHICFNLRCWARCLRRFYNWCLCRLNAFCIKFWWIGLWFSIPFRWIGLWFKRNGSIMTEFQRGYLIKTYRILIQCIVLAILFSVLGNKFGPMITAKWKPPPICLKSVCITVPEICKVISFTVSLPFLLDSSSYELIRVDHKQRLVWVTSTVMSIISVHPLRHQRYRDTYLLTLLLISSLSVNFVAMGIDTYEKLQFLPRILLYSLFLLFASGTVFVTLIGYVALTQFFIHACVMASCQVLLADFTMGTFRLDVYNTFVQVLLVILITEMV